MSFELGKYALPILSAYAVSFLLLALLIGYFLWRSAQSKMELEEAKGLQDA
tara:strand:- start:435 stop:587 length:153 start_codon:yes stop_codon:yes gene_type:complete